MGVLVRAVVVTVGMAVVREVVRYALDRYFDAKDAKDERAATGKGAPKGI
jgi:hypothetical protein